ncbi:MAG: hypothetical protein CVV34_00875 [Methanomicrobiales archaeon HGW-Methanomicrobiales-5]|nr:MAG: hypothetical protein CVV34_00875 [Methanomicrobiales archaeon HGW-Methanomicrobiales-5]
MAIKLATDANALDTAERVKASPAEGRPRPAYSEESHESRRHRAARQNLERPGDPAGMILLLPSGAP